MCERRVRIPHWGRGENGRRARVTEKRKVNEGGGWGVTGERETETQTKKQEGKAKSFLILTRGT